MATTIDAGLTVATVGGRIVPALDFSRARVDNVRLTVLQGPALPGQINAALSSAAVLSALQGTLRAIPPSQLALGASVVPNSLAFGGVTATLTNFTVVPLDGMLAVAADLEGYSAGDPARLSDLTVEQGPTGIAWLYNEDDSTDKRGGGYGTPGAGIDLAVVTNGPAMIASLNGPVAAALAQQPLPGGTKITRVVFRLGDYQIPFDPIAWLGMIVEVDVADGALGGSVTLSLGTRLRGAGSGSTDWVYKQAQDVWLLQVDRVDINLNFWGLLSIWG